MQVTSLRDGMNLVSYEYVACQRDNAGVLVLSEFAGAAQSLGGRRAGGHVGGGAGLGVCGWGGGGRGVSCSEL
jgi:hypothetical protein